ncbi:MAG: amidohydrolase [Gammaproteobacteria bacterium TMED134]|nr:MAG: amidohydrolase [Gammaproteobacteria bacterium TMED134]RPG46856.1 MAG: amidohydrolase [Gammaproteobacteria bacterium TMED134]|tara:strand:- start:9758 stop:11455 length:1698 start_codon:yes stop_codon:yes gene_type:complete
MEYDIIIRGGRLVDGSGSEPVFADLGICGDIITALGDVEGSAKKEIDAAGMIVTPGFIDLHTHLDAQIGWDPMMTPVSWHGVTTALLGNCGVTFAPCRPADREFLAGMMETVEDIPKDAILNGLPWDWEGYGGYLDAVENLKPAINVGGLVGHCALRFYVMGERSVDDSPSPEELTQLADLAAQSVAEGALGFSTSRYLGHYLPDGRHVPGTHAQPDELLAIAKGVGDQGGLMQGVMNFETDHHSEIQLIGDKARAGARVLFSAGAGADSRFSDFLKENIGSMRDAEGLDINAVTIPRSGGFVSSLHNALFIKSPEWKALFAQPFADRLAAINDPGTMAALISEAEAASEADPARYADLFGRLFWMGDGTKPNYVQGGEGCLAALAREAGEHPAATWLRMMRESDGKALFTLRLFNPNLDHLEDLIKTDWALPGLGDAGAHVGQIMDCGWATFVLSHWHRDTGVYSLAEAVRRITSAPARILNIQDRGRLAVGMKADINVIDLARLSEQMPEFVYDFPGGAGRFIQRAEGYRATLCNGALILENDELLGTRAGKVIRSTDDAVRV